MLKPLTKYWFSETAPPPKEARLPNAASPLTVPGASRATEVMSRGTGIFAICSAVRIVVDSTDATSIALMMAALDRTTVEGRGALRRAADGDLDRRASGRPR